MNNPASSPDNALAGASREEVMAALFANMVIQQTNMAMMLMGKTPHPETGETILDLEAAKMFIDQLEMLEVKTKGNLSKQEDGLMKQALAALHMTFVESVDAHGKPAAPAAGQPVIAEAPATEAKPVTPPAAAEAPASEESRKKFSKKY